MTMRSRSAGAVKRQRSHAHATTMRATQRATSREEHRPTAASTETKPRLFDEHLADLRKSGLSDETIATMDVRSLSGPELASVLGYVPTGVQSALAISYPGLDFARYKLFPPGRDANGHPIRYLQPSGSGVHLYVLPGVRALLADATRPLYWAEGEKKAGMGTQEGFPCVGLGGLWNWVQSGTADGITELNGIVHVEREEFIVPDSDVWTRPDLLQAVFAFGKDLEARGGHVRVVILPGPEGAKVGLDDYLVGYGVDTFRALPAVALKHSAFTKQRDWYKSWKTARTKGTAANAMQGQPLAFPTPEPWPSSVEGASLLDEMAAVHRRYAVLPESAADAAALWDLHTYVIDALQVSPVFVITSPQKRCGKSTHLDVHHSLANRPVTASSISPAALFRVVEMYMPTLLIDEADTFLKEREELRGILNAGHTRSTAQVIRTVGDDHEPRIFRTFCPKAIAAIGALPGTIEDRAIRIRMKRRTPGERVDRLRRDRIDAELKPLRSKAARWAEENAALVHDAEPDVPSTLHDRAADNWRPLLAIADLAGGIWPQRARNAAKILSGVDDDTQDLSIELLGDIREVFTARNDGRIGTDELLRALHGMKERPWGDLYRGQFNARGVARLLKPFGIASKTMRLKLPEAHPEPGKANIAKGYERADFEDAFRRYLPDSASVTALRTAPGQDKVNVSHPLPAGEGNGSKRATSAREIKGCNAVTDTPGSERAQERGEARGRRKF